MRVAVTWPCNVTYNSFFLVGRLLVKSLVGHVEVTSNPGDADLRIHVGTPEPEQAWMYGYRPEDLIFYTFAEATARDRQMVTEQLERLSRSRFWNEARAVTPPMTLGGHGRL